MNLTSHTSRLFFSLCILLTAAGLAAAERSKRPNILIVLVDDLGSQDLGCYGNRFIDTPNMDRLAADGMRWTQAYSACPVCSPSRVAEITGRSPARVRFTGHITAIDRHRWPKHGAILPPDDNLDIPLAEITIAEALKPAGYTSVHVGKWHVGHQGFFPTDQGFNVNIGGDRNGAPASYFWPYKNRKRSVPVDGGKEGDYLTDHLTDKTLQFIEEHKGGPFLVHFTPYAVHTPLQAPEELVAKYEKRAKKGQAADQASRIKPVYAAMVERMDSNLGRMLDKLDELGIADDTVVIFSSDNGAVATSSDNRPFRLGKANLYEGGVRVPLIIRWPGKTKPGSVSDAPTITEDLHATIVDLVDGAKPAEVLDGRSLARDIKGNPPPAEEAELHWYWPHYVGKTGPGAAIRAGNWKLIDFYDPPRRELYDLKNDVGEANNLSESNPKKAVELQSKLDAWLARVNPIRHRPNPDWTGLRKD